MKDEEIFAVTCATVTMELGIDIGRLERVLQSRAPNSVTSFLQRLGRSGRRGGSSGDDDGVPRGGSLPNTPLPQLIPWELLRGIAIIQLYIEERFIEPPARRIMPMSLLFHQTLSMLAASGELAPRRLAERVLSLPPFAAVTKEDYRTLLVSMLEHEYLQMTEEKGADCRTGGGAPAQVLQILCRFQGFGGLHRPRRLDEIGTITTPPRSATGFCTCRARREVEELDVPRKLIYVRQVDGKMGSRGPGDFGEINTRILERMRRVLAEDTVYPYLKPNARHRLEVARHVARNTGMTGEGSHCLLPLGGYSWCLFPWLGTRSFRTLRKFLQRCGGEFRISNLEFEGCYYMTFRMERGNDYELISALDRIASTQGIDCEALVQTGELPVFEKYDEYVPGELLRRAYAADRLRADEVIRRLHEMAEEY